MKLKIEISDRFRRGVIITLNVIKVISAFLGVIGFLFFACGMDSDGYVFKYFTIGLIVSISLIVTSMLNEYFVVNVLLKNHERIYTLYTYGNYSSKYDSYVKDMQRRKRIKEDKEKDYIETYDADTNLVFYTFKDDMRGA